MHHDVRHLAVELIGRFGSTPDARYSSLLLHYADLLTGADVGSLLRLAVVYIVMRFVEAYGLWRDRAWGEWLAALSGAIYIPFELQHLTHRLSFITAAVFIVNVCMVAFLAFRLWRRSAHTMSAAKGKNK